MGQKTLIRLLIALGVIGVIAAILHFTGSGGGVSEVERTTSKRKVFKDFPINEVSRVLVEAKDASVTLVKGEKNWEVIEREGYPADPEPIVKLLKDIWDLNIAQPVTIGRSQFSRLNLVAPEEAASAEDGATLLKFQDNQEKDLGTLWLGKVYERSENRPNPFGGGMATTDAGRYVKTGSSNSVYLVGETFSSVNTDPAEWIDKSFFKVEGVKSIAIDRGEPDKDWKLVRNSPEDDFAFANAKKSENLDPAKTASMKSAFSNPQIEDVFVGEAAKENEPTTATFTVSTFDGFHYNITVGEKNDLNELPLTVEVSAKFEEKRKVGEEENDEEKTRLDKQFEENLTKLKEKLASEKKLEGHVFKVRSYLVDPLDKDRSELLKEEEKEGAPATNGEQVAPGISLPGLPEAKPKATPKSEPKPKAAPKPKPEAAPQAKSKPEVTPKSEPKSETVPEAESKPKAAPKSAPKPKAASKAESKPEAAPKSEPKSETAPKPE